MKILVLFAHPALEKSRINCQLIRGLASLPNVTFHDLYQHYPDFDIDVDAEQALLVSHDVIVFQHPFFWYSIPALMKEWIDLVLTHGWAYGSKGNALEGKYALHAISTGAPEAAYGKDGFHGLTMAEFLYPLERTHKLCKMNYLPPFIVHGTHLMEEADVAAHKKDYNTMLAAIAEDRFDLKAAASQARLNADLNSLIKSEEN